jgi:hypothetical protein
MAYGRNPHNVKIPFNIALGTSGGNKLPHVCAVKWYTIVLPRPNLDLGQEQGPGLGLGK